MKKILLLDVFIFLFVLLFAYAAISKLMDVEVFRAQIGKSPLITHYSSLVAWTIPSLEVVIAILLLIPRTQLFALFAFFSLMVTFTFYIGFILTFSPYVPCSCGGILNSMGWTEHLIFNTTFIVLSVVSIVLHNRQNRKVQHTVKYYTQAINP